ncbi:hypothetical protein SynWH8101_1835 [Synechococcus sp. WH 8101]|nr:hypothetical protein SynWH8101_1835 [Synechococcus sp. WH 8101]
MKLSGARWNTPAEEKGILGFDWIADAGQKLFKWLAREPPRLKLCS